MINSVALGGSVLKMIERRHKNDLFLALGGMVSGCGAGAVVERARVWEVFGYFEGS